MATEHSTTHRGEGQPGAVQDMGAQQGKGVADTVKDKAQEVAHQVSDFTGHAKDRVHEWAGDVSHRAVEAKDRVMDWGSHACENTSAMMKTAGQETTDLIRRYPFAALAVGFGVGFMLAQFMHRRCS